MSSAQWLDNLNDILVPHIYRGLSKVYIEIRRLSEMSQKQHGGGNRAGKTLMTFQLALSKIKDMPNTRLQNDYEFLLDSLNNVDQNEKWLRELFTNALMSYARDALASEGIHAKLNRNHLTVPSNQDFIHNVYINSARIFWCKPQLFYHKLDSISIQENINEIHEKIKQAITKTVRDSVGLDKIFRTFDTKAAKPVRKIDIKKHFITEKSLLDSDTESDSDIETEISELENRELTAKNIEKLQRKINMDGGGKDSPNSFLTEPGASDHEPQLASDVPDLHKAKPQTPRKMTIRVPKPPPNYVTNNFDLVTSNEVTENGSTVNMTAEAAKSIHNPETDEENSSEDNNLQTVEHEDSIKLEGGHSPKATVEEPIELEGEHNPNPTVDESTELDDEHNHQATVEEPIELEGGSDPNATVEDSITLEDEHDESQEINFEGFVDCNSDNIIEDPVSSDSDQETYNDQYDASNEEENSVEETMSDRRENLVEETMSDRRENSVEETTSDKEEMSHLDIMFKNAQTEKSSNKSQVTKVETKKFPVIISSKESIRMAPIEQPESETVSITEEVEKTDMPNKQEDYDDLVSIHMGNSKKPVKISRPTDVKGGGLDLEELLSQLRSNRDSISLKSEI